MEVPKRRVKLQKNKRPDPEGFGLGEKQYSATIPLKMVKSLGLEDADRIEFELNKDAKCIILRGVENEEN